MYMCMQKYSHKFIHIQKHVHCETSTPTNDCDFFFLSIIPCEQKHKKILLTMSVDSHA